MAGFIEGVDRGQATLFPERLEDWVDEDHVVRFVDLFVEELDLPNLGFERATPARTGRPGYRPAVLLKLFIYGYLPRSLQTSAGTRGGPERRADVADRWPCARSQDDRRLPA